MKEIRLRDYQTESIEALRAGVRAGHRAQMLCAPAGSGKCLGRGTPVLMASGEIKPVEDVRVGEQLMGPDGQPRNVLSLATGRELLYRVTPVKGAPYVVNASHILSLRTTTSRDRIRLSDGSVIQPGDDVVAVRADVLYSSNRTAKHNLKGWRSDCIENFQTSYDDEYDRMVPPYILGAWLGDGTTHRPAITKPPCKMVDEWLAYARSLGYRVRTETSGGGCPQHFITAGRDGHKINLLKFRLEDLGCLHEKHIPDAYKFGPAEVRREILAGLIDSDGHISRKGVDWISKSERLANDFAFVARSLGLACYLSKQTKGIRSVGFVGEYWRASVSGDINELPMRDKRAGPRIQKKRHRVTGITIEPIGVGDYFGFEIDGDRLFLLGDFTVTHNTVTSAHLMNEARNKGSRVAFVVDRVALLDQTSAVLDSYGIDHGCQQSGHWRFRPYEPIQVCSAQTIERRGFFPDMKLLIVDEAHCIRRQTIEMIHSRKDLRVVGLSATPFSKGLGSTYTNVVNVTTTNKLIEEGWLVPLTMYAATTIDMTGAKVVAGEWTEKEIEERGLKIVGDIVAEWVDKTNRHFGGPVKTIVFSATVDHGEELCRQFNAAGFNFQQISYRDANEERRRELIAEFRKPDSAIDGLVSCEIFVKGFDCPDVLCGVSARPYRKSLSSHIQSMGRVMRPSPGKKYGLWLDHSGNVFRFAADTEEFFAAGVTTLNNNDLDGKARKEPTEQEKEAIKCAKCAFILPPSARVCPACGHERVRRSLVESVAGTMFEVGHNGKALPSFLQDRDAVWRQLSGYALERKGGDEDAARRFAQAQYKNLYGAFAHKRFDPSEIETPSADLVKRVRSNLIRWAKGRQRMAA